LLERAGVHREHGHSGVCSTVLSAAVLSKCGHSIAYMDVLVALMERATFLW
jgi:hypothetical protein